MAAQGASTADIVNGGLMSLIGSPNRIASAYQRADYSLLGEEFGALGFNAALAAGGVRGTVPGLRMGAQLVVEDFAGSGVGQPVGAAIDGYRYSIGSQSYAVEPGLKMPSSWASGANGGGNLAEVWNLKPTARGTAIESHLAQTEYKDWFNVGQLNNGKFPLVDFQNGNTLVSLKSVDTTGSTWFNRMQDHIYDLGKNGATVNGNPASMVLDLRVQPGGTTAA